MDFVASAPAQKRPNDCPQLNAGLLRPNCPPASGSDPGPRGQTSPKTTRSTSCRPAGPAFPFEEYSGAIAAQTKTAAGLRALAAASGWHGVEAQALADGLGVRNRHDRETRDQRHQSAHSCCAGLLEQVADVCTNR